MVCRLKNAFCSRLRLLFALRAMFFILFFLIFSISNNLLFAQETEAAETSQFWLWAFIGRWHPMIVHFPVTLVFIALLMELIASFKKTTAFRPAIRLLVVTGAVSSIIAVTSGLLLSRSGDYGTDILSRHQWAGIITMILSVFTAFAFYKFSRPVQKTFLIVTTVLVTVAGHYGATLTHGEDYLTEVLPGNKPAKTGNANLVLASQTNGELTEEQVQELNLQVRTILAHNCYNCHGAAKVKAQLRLDSREFIMKGGEHGAALVPGSPQKSEMMRRILLPRGHKEAMPNKGKGLTKDEITVLEYWIKKGAPWPAGEQKSIYKVAPLALSMPEVPAATGDLQNPVDRFVNLYFDNNKIQWAKPVDDRTYIRRVYLDITGLLPAADSVDQFVNDKTANKREALAINLLKRNDDYAQHWLTFWNDALRNDYTGTGYITGGRFDITRWLYSSLQANKPYDQFVKELISPGKQSQGFISGIQWRGVVNASQRVEMQAAQNVSQVFLGLNLKCASCHDSFISDWKLDDSYAFANIFCDSTLEINRCDKPTGKMAGRRMLFKELGQIDTSLDRKKRLQQLADLIVQPKDGRLYRTLVNRVWAQLMGRGIVEPVDVMDNDPWSPQLLDWLAADFISNGYDLKKLIYTIVTSKTYQLPSVSVKEAEMVTAQDFVFHGMLRRRLTAEEFTDAVSVAIEPVYDDSMVVYDLLPKNIKKQMPFPRAALIKNDRFLTALGRPNRETVSTSRVSQASLLQALELTNGSLFNDAIKKGAANWKKKFGTTEQLIDSVYRNALGRMPIESERTVALKMLGTDPKEDAIQDFFWAVTLHPEFQLIF